MRIARVRMQKERKKVNPTKLNRDLGQGRRGASHEKIVAAFFMGAEKSREWEERGATRPRSRQDEGRGGGGKRKPAAYSLAFEIDENKLTPFSSSYFLFHGWMVFRVKISNVSGSYRLFSPILFFSFSFFPPLWIHLYDFRLSKLTPFV